MLRAALYSRVSTSMQATDGTSLTEQQATLRRYCEEYGLQIVEHVEDGGVSGALDERPGLQRLRELARAGSIDVVVCCKVDRLSRKAWLGEAFIDEMESQGIRVLFTDQRFEDDPAGRFARGVMGHVAQLEHSLITARTLSGRNRKAADRRVNPNGKDLYGYRAVSVAEATVLPEYHGRDGELVIVEPEAAVVRRIYREFLAGATLTGLARKLTAEGLRTRAGAVWSVCSVRRILERAAYRGEWSYGMHECRATREILPSGKPRITKKPRDPSEWTSIPIPPIVSEADWQAAQERLTQITARARGRPSTLWLLRSCVQCAVCRNPDGSPVAFRGERRGRNPRKASYVQRRYVCNSQVNPRYPYCGGGIGAVTLERQAWQTLVRVLQPGELAAIAREQAEMQRRAGGDLDTQLAARERELADLDARAERIQAAYEDKVYTIEDTRRRLAPIQARRQAIHAEISALRMRQAQQIDPESAALRAEQWAVRIREWLDDLPQHPDRLQRVYQSLFRITVGRGRAHFDILALVLPEL